MWPKVMKFQMGRLVSTPAALDAISAETAARLIERHFAGDWGDLDEEDKKQNDAAIDGGERIMSVYKLDTVTIWIITEWDRSVTTVLTPQDY